MSEDNRHEMAKKRVVLRIDGTEDVVVRRDLPYGERAGATFRLYTPGGPEPGEPRPAVVFASGYPDPGLQAMVGCRLQDMQGYVDWARLVAASGMAAVTYANEEPVRDLGLVLSHLREHAGALGIDASRLGLWAASGNVPAALRAMMADGAVPIRCAALLYGYTLDLDGADEVAKAQAQFQFANPSAGRDIEDVRPGVELMLVRAGADAMPGINASIDRFAAAWVARDRPLVLCNHARAPHAFDLEDDREESRRVIRDVMAFLAARLGVRA